MQHGKFSFDDLTEQASIPIPYLLEDYIPSNSIGILVGEWGLGKSPFALQLQLSLACNLSFLDRWKPSRDNLRCLYVDMENSAPAVSKILYSQLDFMGANEKPRLEVYSPNYVDREKGYESFSEYNYIKRIIKNDPVDLVIIDPLRAFHPPAETKNNEAIAMIQQLREIISETNTTIMFIHHPRKISGDPSVERYHLDTNPTEWMANACGAASLIQNTDFRIGLEKTEDELIICRRFIRNVGWYPVEYIDRELDNELNPQGYILRLGADLLKPQEKLWISQLPKEFTTKELLTLTGKGRTYLSGLLNRWKMLGVVVGTDKGCWSAKV